MTCSEDLMCETGNCLNSSQFCNGLFDCLDKKDEIKGYEHDWVGVCEDGFGMQEANVFLKPAGFKLGPRRLFCCLDLVMEMGK